VDISWNSYPVNEKRDFSRRHVEQLNQKLKSGEYRLEHVDCINCGSSSHKLLFSNDRYGIKWRTVVCKRCGLVYSNPRFDSPSNQRFYNTDEYRQLYNADDLKDVSPRFAERATKSTDGYNKLGYFEMVRDLLPQIDTVLDFGAGAGSKLLPFIDAGKKCVGYDFSPAMVAAGKEQGIDMVQGGEEAVVGTYDLLMLNHTLEHLLDPIEQLRRLRKNLADDGHLLIEVPGFVDKVPSLQNAHTYYFSPRTLESILGVAGFRLREMREISQNGFILATFTKGDSISSAVDDDEYRRIAAIVRRSRLRIARQLVANRLPTPLRNLAKEIMRAGRRK